MENTESFNYLKPLYQFLYNSAICISPLCNSNEIIDVENESGIIKTIVCNPEILSTDHLDSLYSSLMFSRIINYYYPYLSNSEVNATTINYDIANNVRAIFSNNFSSQTSYILYFNRHEGYKTFQCTPSSKQELVLIITSYIYNNTKTIFCSPKTFDDEFIDVDEETKLFLHKFESNIKQLHESGKLACVIPMLSHLLQQHQAVEKFSRLELNEEFEIILPDYNNLVIPMSPLTRAVYILYLQNAEGIAVDDLIVYKFDLIRIYKNISQRLDYSKQIQSIDELVEKPQLVYMHFSRIKSAFVKKINESIAHEYCITGEKYHKKYIPLAVDKRPQFFL